MQKGLLSLSRRHCSAGVEECDYVVVGGGTAGCVLANRLSADPKNKVVLLEAGGEDDWVWYKVPVGYLFTMMNKRSDWQFSTTPQATLNDRVIAMPRGKTLGGCSSINGAIYMRGTKHDYDEWGSENPGWAWDDVLPYFKQSMDYFKGEDADHGVGGEWTVSAPRVRWDVLDTCQAACEESGLPLQEHFNHSDVPGCGYFQVNQSKGVRVSSATAFLHPVRKRSNLKVLTRCTTEKINFSDNTKLYAESVQYSQNGVQRKVRARKEVILTAGAIGSPHLLEVSGVGRKEVLAEHGVAALRDVRGVGEGMYDHLQIRPVFRLKDGTVTMNQLSQSYFQMAKMGIEYALKGSGPLSMAPSQFGAMAHSSPDEVSPDLEFHMQPLSCERLELGYLHDFPGLTVSVCNLRPTSTGSTHLTSSSIHTAPCIDPRYLSTEEDRRKAVLGIQWARKIVGSQAMQSLAPKEFLPGVDVQTDEEVLESVGRMASSIFHPVSTCRMGPEKDARNVVDSSLKLHCADNVRVVDASIMPNITSGNTCSPVIMIAEKAAEMILASNA